MKLHTELHSDLHTSFRTGSRRKFFPVLISAALLAVSLASCGGAAAAGTATTAAQTAEETAAAGTAGTDAAGEKAAAGEKPAETAAAEGQTAESTDAGENSGSESESGNGQGLHLLAEMSTGGTGPDKSADAELQEMISETAASFSQDTYEDQETGLSVPYNIYVPEGYEKDGTLPIVFFIGDATTAGKSMEYSLTQGWGGIVWATDAVQKETPCIVVTPVFPEVILDDHNGYQTTDYVDLVPRLVRAVTQKYGANPDRIYGTGQSMGAMTTLLTAAKNPDLYAAVLIVDGQWDISELKGIENVKFLYITSAGNTSATGGQTEVKEMLKKDGVAYSEVSDLDARLADSADTKQELEDAVSAILSEGNAANFVTWKEGSVLSMYGDAKVSEHMAAFDYGYKLNAVRSWLLSQ